MKAAIDQRVTKGNSMNKHVDIQHTQEVWHWQQSFHHTGVVFRPWHWFKTQNSHSWCCTHWFGQLHSFLCNVSGQNTEPWFQFAALTLGLYFLLSRGFTVWASAQGWRPWCSCGLTVALQSGTAVSQLWSPGGETQLGGNAASHWAWSELKSHLHKQDWCNSLKPRGTGNMSRHPGVAV